jgi:hypothetical protein
MPVQDPATSLVALRRLGIKDTKPPARAVELALLPEGSVSPLLEPGEAAAPPPLSSSVRALASAAWTKICLALQNKAHQALWHIMVTVAKCLSAGFRCQLFGAGEAPVSKTKQQRETITLKRKHPGFNAQDKAAILNAKAIVRPLHQGPFRCSVR